MKKALRPACRPSPWSEWKVSTTGRLPPGAGGSPAATAARFPWPWRGALALLGAGCQGPSAFALPEHLQIAIAYGGVSDAVARTSLERLAGQMAQEFMQNNPGTNLHPDQ